jgi:hypothetical protein
LIPNLSGELGLRQQNIRHGACRLAIGRRSSAASAERSQRSPTASLRSWVRIIATAGGWERIAASQRNVDRGVQGRAAAEFCRDRTGRVGCRQADGAYFPRLPPRRSCPRPTTGPRKTWQTRCVLISVCRPRQKMPGQPHQDRQVHPALRHGVVSRLVFPAGSAERMRIALVSRGGAHALARCGAPKPPQTG